MISHYLLVFILGSAAHNMVVANNPEPSVVIAGGGPSGLLASILLSNIGVSSTVLERAKEADEWSSKSYTLVLGDNGKASLERGGCLEAAKAASLERKFVSFFDGQTGEVKTIPKKSPGLGFTRPGVVECIETIALGCPRVTVKRGAGVSSVSKPTNAGVDVHLDDGTTLSATHLIGADGKWSKVRQSTPSLSSQAKIVTCPAFGIHMNCPSAPEGFKADRTYVIKPPEEYKFYLIASPRPSGEFSMSMVCSDETLERYPWMELPSDLNAEGYGKGGWEDEYSALPEGMKAESGLSNHMEQLFRDELPALYKLLHTSTFESARINRRTTWLEMSAEEGKSITYSTEDGRIALIGDACHAMTASMGEGCNTAMQSAVKLVDCVSEIMKQKGETTCGIDSLSEGLVQYGLTRPKEVIPIQEQSAARNGYKKTVGSK